MPIMEIDASSETGELERKRENRLTNIVDQLLHSKTSQSRSGAVTGDEAKVERGSHPDDEKSSPLVTLTKAAALDGKTRRKKTQAQRSTIDIVKDERCSPVEPESVSSRIASPQTPSPNSSLRTRTPSFAGTPPGSSFSPTGAYASKAAMMDGLHMSRNYSDFMRSLAAKYNNSNAANDYGRASSFLESPSSRMAAFKGSMGDAGSSASAAISALAAFPQFAFPLDRTGASVKDTDSDPAGKPPPFGLPGLMGADPASVPHLGAGLPGFPMMDMSSTQALLNIVRSASSRNAQHIETYLRGSPVSALKRPATESAPAHHSPLDLSAPPVNKRPYESQLERPAFLAKSIDPDSLPAKKKYLQTEDKLASPRETAKRVPTPKTTAAQFNCRSTCSADACSPAAVEVRAWSVGDVVDFVRSIDLCAEYAEVFREHSIDGSTLPLLTEDHLTSSMSMKLGPALKLRSVLAKRIGHCALCLHCAHCHADASTTTTTTAQSAQE